MVWVNVWFPSFTVEDLGDGDFWFVLGEINVSEDIDVVFTDCVTVGNPNPDVEAHTTWLVVLIIVIAVSEVVVNWIDFDEVSANVFVENLMDVLDHGVVIFDSRPGIVGFDKTSFSFEWVAFLHPFVSWEDNSSEHLLVVPNFITVKIWAVFIGLLTIKSDVGISKISDVTISEDYILSGSGSKTDNSVELHLFFANIFKIIILG